MNERSLISEMAIELCAGIVGGLDTANDRDVIAYLYNAPQRYHHRLILDHYDRALCDARQILVTATAAQADAKAPA